jgi:hypothetical protein
LPFSSRMSDKMNAFAGRKVMGIVCAFVVVHKASCLLSVTKIRSGT